MRSDQLGRAKQVKVDKDNTTIVDGAGDPDAIKDRVASIKAQIEETTSDFDREKLQERLAKLAGGVAVIEVGAATETELTETKGGCALWNKRGWVASLGTCSAGACSSAGAGSPTGASKSAEAGGLAETDSDQKTKAAGDVTVATA